MVVRNSYKSCFCLFVRTIFFRFRYHSKQSIGITTESTQVCFATQPGRPKSSSTGRTQGVVGEVAKRQRGCLLGAPRSNEQQLKAQHTACQRPQAGQKKHEPPLVMQVGDCVNTTDSDARRKLYNGSSERHWKGGP